MNIKTNNQWRGIVDFCNLTEKQQEDNEGLEDSSFFIYRGDAYSLGDFIRIDDKEGAFKGWHGLLGEGYFSAMLVKISDSGDAVIVGRYYE